MKRALWGKGLVGFFVFPAFSAFNLSKNIRLIIKCVNTEQSLQKSHHVVYLHVMINYSGFPDSSKNRIP